MFYLLAKYGRILSLHNSKEKKKERHLGVMVGLRRKITTKVDFCLTKAHPLWSYIFAAIPCVSEFGIRGLN